VNVGNTNSWVEEPKDYGGFFQYNKTLAWHPTDPANGVAIPGWPAADTAKADWASENNPCPTGWRLPTRAEFMALDSASKVGNGAVGGAGVNAGVRGAAVAGRFYGPRAGNTTSPATTCSINANNDNMHGCIFLPAAGFRNADGSLINQGQNLSYWCSTFEKTTGSGYALFAGSVTPYTSKNMGYNIRCVR